jgi:3-deoxy-D-manno-octulosonic acid kinase
MLYDAALSLQPGADLFDPDWWRDRGALLGEASGRGLAYFIDGGETEWVLRHFRRGGMVGRLIHDRYLFTGVNRSRPFREARLLARLASAGLPVPRPVAARVELRLPFYRGDLISERVPGEPLSRWLKRDEADVALFRSVGQVVRRFHDQGVFHADLNAHNILVSEGDIHLIDFDRGRVRRPGRWQQANLFRLTRSLHKLLDDRADEARWRQCMDALWAGWHPDSPTNDR